MVAADRRQRMKYCTDKKTFQFEDKFLERKFEAASSMYYESENPADLYNLRESQFFHFIED